MRAAVPTWPSPCGERIFDTQLHSLSGQPGRGFQVIYSPTRASALLPEALAAHAVICDEVPRQGLLCVTSPDLLHRG